MQKNLISRSLALVGGALLSTALMAKPPNIFVIMSDDVGWQNVSAYSHGVMGYDTPNIDRIAQEGVMFTDHYAQPSSTAGRAAFITAQYPIRSDIVKLLYYSYKIRKKLEITHRLSRSTILYAYV